MTIPIDIDNWLQVPDEKKNAIWETVQVRAVLSFNFNYMSTLFVLMVVCCFFCHIVIGYISGGPQVKEENFARCW